jgi:hypothetical protein
VKFSVHCKNVTFDIAKKKLTLRNMCRAYKTGGEETMEVVLFSCTTNVTRRRRVSLRDKWIILSTEQPV